LLLSALWDAAFDAGLVSFADDGTAIASPRLTTDSATALGLSNANRLTGLTGTHRANLAWHRSRYGF
jgi:putative restriction endonuclease